MKCNTHTFILSASVVKDCGAICIYRFVSTVKRRKHISPQAFHTITDVALHFVGKYGIILCSIKNGTVCRDV